MPYATRLIIGILLLVVIAMCATGLAVYDAVSFYHKQDMDETLRYANAVEPLRPYLPKGEPLGYVSDIWRDGQMYTRPYFNVRYVMSPTQVTWETDREWLIALFQNPNNLSAFLRQNGYVIVKNGERGALLLRKKPR